MSLTLALILIGVGCLAGAINAAVGSGTLLVYPVLLAAGVPPVVANGTNTTGLSPGSFASAWAYRDELRPRMRQLAAPVVATVLTAGLGASLVVALPTRVFTWVVPFLVGLATLLIALQPFITRWTRAHALGGRHALWPWTGAVGLYGGYFGAAQGIMLMAVLGARYDRNTQHANAAKNLLAACANVTAAVVFAVSGSVLWTAAVCLAVGSLPGGYLGGRLARRLPQTAFRALIIVIGVAATVYLFARML